ncbi:hypothetical protein DD238_006760 [Peronospora effusa]|uniref:Uncharacterized protein n=1 Tax=Peronospora effusa TaxID=542832 RepID=A0A3M6VDY2_9STRA|nr:hypothetical protein DD238_006760 [Peronospora effusa]
MSLSHTQLNDATLVGNIRSRQECRVRQECRMGQEGWMEQDLCKIYLGNRQAQAIVESSGTSLASGGER